jgi:F-type H+-transporting ATPase subunit delta
MTGNRAAIRYAKAILEVSQNKGTAVAVNDDMKTIADTVHSNHELRDFLSSPIIKVEVKWSAIAEVFANVQEETKSLFQLLNANRRFELLGNIATQYNKLFDVATGVETAFVTTAIEITAELEAKVLAKAATFSNKKITIVNIVDPAIIGGFILRIGDQQYNASVANSLRGLKREFAQ